MQWTYLINQNIFYEFFLREKCKIRAYSLNFFNIINYDRVSLIYVRYYISICPYDLLHKHMFLIVWRKLTYIKYGPIPIEAKIKLNNIFNMFSHMQTCS